MEPINRKYIIREPISGDFGAIIYGQAVLYKKEYDWNFEYEGLISGIISKYIKEYDSTCEKCWIAELDGKVVGSIFIVRHDEQTAKLRLLYVDSSARGLGIGNRLVEECIEFSKQVGYKKVILWTNSILTTARKLYDKYGFKLIQEETINAFGHTGLTAQTFSKDL